MKMNEKLLLLIVVILVVVVVIAMMRDQRTSNCHQVASNPRPANSPVRKSAKSSFGLQEFKLPFIDQSVFVDVTEPKIVLPLGKFSASKSLAKENRIKTETHCSENPPDDTLISLDGQNCLAHENSKKLPESKDLNKYLNTFNYTQLCDHLSLPLAGYNGVVNPSALFYTPTPALVVPPGQKGFNMVPPYPSTPFVDLTGKNVLVVGASKGLGLATATMFKANGCNVIGTSRYPQCYPNTEYTFPLLKLDIRLSKKVRCFFQKLMAHHFTNGRIDILVNCPGIHWHGQMEDADGDDLSDMLSFQVGGYQRVVFNALPHMKHSNFCKVISFGSIAAYFPTGLGGYSIAKRALQNWNDIHMTDALIRKATGQSTYEPTFTLVEPGFIQATIGLYESYKAAQSDINDVQERGTNLMIMALQSANTIMTPILSSQPPCPAAPAYCQNIPQLVSDAIYQIAIAPQPSIRYLIDPSPPETSFISALAGLNILSADDAVTAVTMPIVAGLFLPPPNAALAQAVLSNSFCN
jgi:NAD(P)-dependent dehydrogenase (short-subunit alcohol dehydrogenase family)